jgi:hypothetical protein
MSENTTGKIISGKITANRGLLGLNRMASQQSQHGAKAGTAANSGGEALRNRRQQTANGRLLNF